MIQEILGSLREDSRMTVTRSDSTMEAESIRVLAVTAHRPAEAVNSVREMDTETEILVLDDSASLISRARETIHRTNRMIKSHDPDILLLDCYEVMGFLTTLLALWYGVPTVGRVVGDTWRGLDEEGAQPAWRNGEYKKWARYRLSLILDEFIFASAVGFVAVSRELRDVIHRRTGCPRDRIGVVPVPVTNDTWGNGSEAEARRITTVDQDRVLLTVTNLKFRPKYEGVKTMVNELQSLLEENPDLAYVIAGDGSYHADLQRYLDETVDDPAVRKRFYTPGFVDDVADLYSMADIFVYVSYRDGYPNVVLEAQTAGLAVVANDAYGMSEQITNGETGYLVDPDEPGMIRKQVEELIINPDVRDRLGNAARERVLRENTPDAVSRQLQTFLVSVMNDLTISG